MRDACAPSEPCAHAHHVRGIKRSERTRGTYSCIEPRRTRACEAVTCEAVPERARCPVPVHSRGDDCMWVLVWELKYVTSAGTAQAASSECEAEWRVRPSGSGTQRA